MKVPVTHLRAVRLLLFALIIWGLAGCGGLRPHAPPPAVAEAQVQVPGIPNVRVWGDEFSPVFQKDILDSIQQEKQSGLFKEGGTVDILAISGGGGDGAFGAGLLCGWTAAGNRPIFKMVTGISTGALTAPFAFLGPAYDDKLKKVYTTISSQDILKLKSFFSWLRGDSISVNDPLAKLTADYVDDKMLKDIAAEHAKGRRLYIGTTALDAQRPVVWNMGAIAASGHPDAPTLFRKIMIASAAVPVVFPPAYFGVEAGGKRYDEMHVDGGVANQVFLYGPMLDVAKARKDLGLQKLRRNFRVFVLRNTRIKPSWEDMTPLMRKIAPRSVSSLIKAQGVGDLYRIYVSSLQDGLDFNLAYIPDALDTNRSDEFDTRVMNVLFDTGYRLASRGYHWFKHPPGLPGGGSNGSQPARQRLDQAPDQAASLTR
ncbi:MAG: patatin [Proteobacteria bacterium]|nr:patatin [Pseudomonadota bacterium]